MKEHLRRLVEKVERGRKNMINAIIVNNLEAY